VGQTLLGLLALLFYFSIDVDLIYAAMICVAIVLAIFLHELGHAWGNIVQDVPVRRIMLHGAGGFCESKRSANAYQQELIVAMGPIVNAVLWAVCSLFDTVMWNIWANAGTEPGYVLSEVMYFIWLFAQINLLLFIFNMIPVQPLDGGKLFHLVMLRFTNGQSAQMITGAVGLALSIAWIPAMIAVFFYQGWVLFFIPSIAAHFHMMRGARAY
jgi:Zn-dependent protease